MKTLGKYLLRGTVFFLPFALTIYILYILILWSESWVANSIKSAVPGFYIPGLGLIVAAAFLIFVGFLVSLPSFSRVLSLIELPFKNVPIIKSVYSAIRNLADFFSPEGENPAQQVVLVKQPGSELEIIGFLTRSNFNDLPEGFPKSESDKVAVYIPMSYQIGGLTFFLPKSWITPVNMPVEQAMRSTLTAWMSMKK